MILSLEEMLALERKIYIAMAEVDHDLRAWHAAHYSPSRAIVRAGPFITWGFRMAFWKAVNNVGQVR